MPKAGAGQGSAQRRSCCRRSAPAYSCATTAGRDAASGHDLAGGRSKATDILPGLRALAVRRVERGVAFEVQRAPAARPRGNQDPLHRRNCTTRCPVGARAVSRAPKWSSGWASRSRSTPSCSAHSQLAEARGSEPPSRHSRRRRRRSNTSVRATPNSPRPVRCRTRDVRAGQREHLPAQGVQCKLGHRRQAAGKIAVRDDQEHRVGRAAAPLSAHWTRGGRHRSVTRAASFFADADGYFGARSASRFPFAIKVETHNHPTAIAPYPVRPAGAGGEIRDEGATGRGAKPKSRPRRLHDIVSA